MSSTESSFIYSIARVNNCLYCEKEVNMLEFLCKTERALFFTLKLAHMERIKYGVTSTEDERGKITFHVFYYVDETRYDELNRKQHNIVY